MWRVEPAPLQHPTLAVVGADGSARPGRRHRAAEPAVPDTGHPSAFATRGGSPPLALGIPLTSLPSSSRDRSRGDLSPAAPGLANGASNDAAPGTPFPEESSDED